eukprot:365249-Chlamydomonas_euryale.AAC.16
MGAVLSAVRPPPSRGVACGATPFALCGRRDHAASRVSVAEATPRARLPALRASTVATRICFRQARTGMK